MKLKKFLTGVVAAAMVLSMSTTAFANEDGALNDMRTVTITKNYEAENTGTTSPGETFHFTIDPTSVTDAATGVTKDNMPLPTIGDVEYNRGDAGSADKSKGITVTLPTYTSVGIYTYTIHETVGDTAGVTYRSDAIRLVVTVLQGENGYTRIAAVHTENEDGEKTGSFDDNKYSAGSLEVSKQVTGNLGDRDKNFDVTVTFNAPEGLSVREAISYIDDGEEKTIPATWTGTKEVNITLKHDETVTFSNIPYGVTYTVTEADYTGADGYDKADYVYSDKDNKKIDSDKDTVQITNNKGTGEIDTGITLDNLPYIMILALVAVAMVALLGKKRFARN